MEAPAETPARILSLDGTPHVIDWGDYRNLLDGDPIFVMGFTVVTGSLLKRTGFGISRSAQQTLAEGSEYLWDKQTLSQSFQFSGGSNTTDIPLQVFRALRSVWGRFPIKPALLFSSRILKRIFTPEPTYEKTTETRHLKTPANRQSQEVSHSHQRSDKLRSSVVIPKLLLPRATLVERFAMPSNAEEWNELSQ